MYAASTIAPPVSRCAGAAESRELASLGEAGAVAVPEAAASLATLRDLVYPIWQFVTLDQPAVLPVADSLVVLFALGTGDGLTGGDGLIVRLAGLAFVLMLLHRAGAPLSTKLLLAGVAAGPALLGLASSSEHVQTLMRGALLGFVFVAGASVRTEGWKRETAYPFAVVLLAGTATVALPLAVYGLPWSVALFTGCALAVGPFVIGVRIPAVLAGGAAMVLVLLLPLLREPPQPLEAFRGFFSMLALFTLALMFARRRAPAFLARLERERGFGPLVLSIAVICLPALLVADLLGLGLAAGFFVAGAALSRSVVRREIAGPRPLLRQAVASAFYVLLGLLLDLDFLWRNAPFLLSAAGVCLLTGFILRKLADQLPYAGRLRCTTTSSVFLPAGAFGLLLVLAARESGLSPAGMGVAGEQAFIAVTALLTVAAPLPAVIRASLRRWRLRHFAGTPAPRGSLPGAAPDKIGDRPAHRHAQGAPRPVADRYLLRGQPAAPGRGRAANDPTLDVVTVEGGAPAEGLQLWQLEKWLLMRYDLSILCVWRGDVVLLAGWPEGRLRAGDRIVLSGRPRRFAESTHLFHSIPPGMT